MFGRGIKCIFLILVICLANLLLKHTIANPLHKMATHNGDIAKVKSVIKEGTAVNTQKFSTTSPVTAALQNDTEIGELLIANFAWGEKSDGLRIGILEVKRAQDDEHRKPQFNVALQNVGQKDLVLNLGIMLANGKEQYSNAVKLIFTDPNGKTYEFHNNIGRHPGIAGRVDPFVVPLAVGCTYILRVDFDNYWAISPKRVPLSLPKREYRLVSVFEGKAVTFEDTHVYTRELYWTGVIKSEEVIFKSHCVTSASQKSNFTVSERQQEQQGLQNHTKWISQCLMRIQSIKPGATRADLPKVFTTEGGLSTRSWRRYVYRECPYIKVDVHFKAVDNDKWPEKSDDVITKISNPFLEWSIAN